MAQAGHQAGLAAKAFLEARLAAHGRQDDLDGDRAVQVGVMAFVDLGHAAAGHQADEGVLIQGLGGHRVAPP